MKPFLKWVGGKAQLLPELHKYIPNDFSRYYEPFVGAGALLFNLHPRRAIINDLNGELINCYKEIRACHKAVIDEFENDYLNTKEDYERIRAWDRTEDWPENYLSYKRAARTIYLNKNGFNGLYRVNSKGQFNVPYGKHTGKFIPDVENITAVSQYLNENDVSIRNMDFEEAVMDAENGDFIYFDPPYDPVSETADFASYTAAGFRKTDQECLSHLCRELHQKGVKVMISNSDTSFINSLYWDFNIHKVQARRAINCNGDKRGKVRELIITSY